MGSDEQVPAGGAPIFLISFRHRDAMVATTEQCGWAAVGARRAEGAERRFIASGASVAVIDLRGAVEEGLRAIRLLSDAAEANAAALLALVDLADVGRLDDVYAAGATHYLVAPFEADEYRQAVRFACRLGERVAGRSSGIRRDRTVIDEPLGWQWRRGQKRVTVSRALADMLGCDEDGFALDQAGRVLGAACFREARAAVARVAVGGNATVFVHHHDDRRFVHHVQRAGDGVVVRIEELARVGQDDDALRRDPLTGLADAVSARRWLDRPSAAAGALLLLSVSRLEIVTAAFGRQTGDALLKIVARRIERLALRGERLVARMAGAEFAVGLPGPATAEEAAFLGRSLADAAARPFVAGEHVVELAVHVGVAVAGPGDDGAALLRRASGALAEAKAAEGDPVRLLTERQEAETAAAEQLEIDLRTALAEGQIELLYQPQIAVTTGSIVGVEALARWRHPRLGELGAETLFAAAERSDYLVQLSRHVQERVVAEVTAWPQCLSRLRVAINVTAVEMALPDFADSFLARLDGGGLSRRRVTVEVTEGGLIEDLTGAAAMLAKLRAGGCRVAIDDFGTGYSSLAYLKALPLDYLKIDKKLAQDIAGSPRDRVVVRGVIDMARSLGLSVIAEGVETAEQLSLLAQEGCNVYQGFLSAPPLDLVALEAIVTAQAA